VSREPSGDGEPATDAIAFGNELVDEHLTVWHHRLRHREPALERVPPMAGFGRKAGNVALVSFAMSTAITARFPVFSSSYQ
jgi:hypothetical protein